MERCGRSSRECAYRGWTRGSSSLVYAQLRVGEVSQFLSVWFWSLCGLPVCRTRVRRKCGAMKTSTAHCQCSWKVREGRTTSERVVVPLQSFKFFVLYCEQVKISHGPLSFALSLHVYSFSISMFRLYGHCLQNSCASRWLAEHSVTANP